jgi:RNA polymerase sigma factor (sigma-70 family)
MDEDGSTAVDRLVDPHARVVDATAEELASALAQLPDRKRFIVEEYYGLADGVGRTCQEISEALGVTREAVRKQLMSALEMLQESFA